MIIDLITLEKTPYAFDVRIAPEEIELDSEDFRLKSAVNAAGKLTKHIAQIDVEGKITADAELNCTRCLTAIDKKLDIPFKTIFVTAEVYTAAKEAELQAEDLDVSVYDGQEIDLTELIREQILLNLPEQVFCKEECKGLCEKCGANRNLIDCKCIENEVDPRWAALKNLK